MKIEVSYDEVSNNIKILRRNTVPEKVWHTIYTDIQNKQETLVKKTEISLFCERQSFERSISTLQALLNEYKEYGLKFEFDDYIKNFLKQHYDNLKKAEEINNHDINLTPPSEDELKKVLVEEGINIEKKPLKDHQLECIIRLVSMSHGANFSVPGSGKTYVTLSVFTYLKKILNLESMVVICPKNAFGSWGEEITDLVSSSNDLSQGMTRLEGSDQNIENLLKSGKKYFITNYELIRRSNYHIRKYLENTRTHLILDESHKIKNDSEQSISVRSLSYAAKRRDILTGTPMPKSIDDLRNQLYFLWGQTAINNFILPNQPNQNISVVPNNVTNFFVRTNKKRLGLKKPKIIFQNVDMSEAQLLFYSFAMSPLLNIQSSQINADNISSIRRSLMRLIAISSNPQVVLERLFLGENNSHFLQLVHNDFEEKLIRQLDEERFSNKLKIACEIARENTKKGEKTIIWSFFRHNVEYLANYMLTDLDAEYIHGSVEIGEDTDLSTREGKIKKFREDDNCSVLVANFAACSEGISLQKVCNNAIYIDRSYQAEHYLQSIDRIHRLGNNDQKKVTILHSSTPKEIRNIDLAISINLRRKISRMGLFLRDDRLVGLAEEGTITENSFSDESLSDISALAEDFLNSKIGQ